MRYKHIIWLHMLMCPVANSYPCATAADCSYCDRDFLPTVGVCVAANTLNSGKCQQTSIACDSTTTVCAYLWWVTEYLPCGNGCSAVPGEYCESVVYPEWDLVPIPCPATYYCPAPSMASPIPCSSCSAGQMRAFDCISTNNTRCTACPAYTFALTSDATECTSVSTCAPGTFFVSASDGCQLCPVGFHCPNVRTKTRCTAGYSCPAGSTAPAPLPQQRLLLCGGNACPRLVHRLWRRPVRQRGVHHSVQHRVRYVS